MDWHVFKEESHVDGLERLEALFTDIESKARTSGRGELVMMLDRVPGVLIGHENSRDNDVLERSMAQSFERLKEISQAIQNNANHN